MRASVRRRIWRRVLAFLVAAGLTAGLGVVGASSASAAQVNCYGIYFNVGSQQAISCQAAASRASWVPYNGNFIVGAVSGFCQNKWRSGFFPALTTARKQWGESRGQALAYAGTVRGSICP